jgi:hypothetical protein
MQEGTTVTDEQTTQDTAGAETTGGTKDAPYHVSDLSDDQVPDPLGDASVTAHERAGATGSDE